MRFQMTALSLLFISGLSSAAPGRSPAVEDFVGIEVEQLHATPHVNESLFNLERDITQIEGARKKGPVDMVTPNVAQSAAPAWGMTSILGVLFILGLPMISWMLVMNHLRNKASEENISNIEVLEKYRLERELARSRAKKKEFKKAS